MSSKRMCDKKKIWLNVGSKNVEEIKQYCHRSRDIVGFSRSAKNSAHVFISFSTKGAASQAMNIYKADGFKCNYAHTNEKFQQLFSNQCGIDYAESSSDQSKTKSTVDVQNSQTKSSKLNGSNGSDEPTEPDESSGSNGAQKSIFQNGDEIIITHINIKNGPSFYARKLSEDRKYRQLIKTASILEKEAKPLIEMPKKSGFVFAPYKGEYWRGHVLNSIQSKTEFVRIRIVDIGALIDVPLNQLKMMPSELALVRLTSSFMLNGDEKYVNCPYALKCLKSYIGSSLRLECKERIAESRSRVKLIDGRTEQNIEYLLNQMSYTYRLEKLVRKPAILGKDRTLVVVDDTQLMCGQNLITFVDEVIFNDFNIQINQIDVFGNGQQQFPAYLPEEGQLCLVKSDDRWHRGIFIENQAVNANIFLVDVGKVVQCELANIRNFTEILLRMPLLSFVAVVDGVAPQFNTSKYTGFLQKFKLKKHVRVLEVTKSAQDDTIYNIRI